jgi:hypothetical protein
MFDDVVTQMRCFYDSSFARLGIAMQRIVAASMVLAPGRWLILWKGCALFQPAARGR